MDGGVGLDGWRDGIGWMEGLNRWDWMDGIGWMEGWDWMDGEMGLDGWNWMDGMDVLTKVKKGQFSCKLVRRITLSRLL